MRVSRNRFVTVAALTSLAAVAFACSRETKGPDQRTQASQQKVGATGAANAVANLPSVDVAADTVPREMRDADALLKSLGDDAAKKRAEADQKIRERVTALEGLVDNLERDLTEAVKRLDAKDAQLAESLAQQALSQKIERDKLRLDMDKGFSDARAELARFREGIHQQIATAAERRRLALSTDLASIEQQLGTAAGADFAKLQADKERLTKRIEICQDAMSGELQALLVKGDDLAAMSEEDLKASLEAELGSGLAGARAFLAVLVRFLEAELAAAPASTKPDVQKELDDIGLLATKPDDALKASLLVMVNADLPGLRKMLDEIVFQLRREIAQAVGEAQAFLAQRLSEADDDVRASLHAEMSKRFNEISEDLAASKDHADKNFSTKAELQVLKVVVLHLKNMTNVLNKKRDENDAAINARLPNGLMAAKTELRAEIASVQADADSVRSALCKHIQTYKTKLQELEQAARKESFEVRALLGQLQINSQTGLEALSSRLGLLTNKVTSVEVYAQDVRASLGEKITELRARDAELSSDARRARDEAQASFLNAIAVEQAARLNLEAIVAHLADEVGRMSEVANQSLNLANANEVAIRGLREDLARARTEFGVQMAALHNEMKARISEVRLAAESLVADLGREVQAQFVETTVGLAELRAKDAAASDEVARFIADVVKNTTAIENFKTTSRPLQEKLLVSVGNVGSALASIEGEFLDAIGFVHGNKGVDVRGLNESFKPVAGLRACGGITGMTEGQMGRNAAVNDLEWHFHLARAYSQMLLSGVRSGNAELDRIFFGASPVVSGKGLVSAILLEVAPSRALGAGGECATKVSDWARATLAASTLDGKALRDALMKSTALRNAVVTLLESRVKALIAPAMDFEKAIIAVVRPHLATDDAVARLFESEPAPGLHALVAQLMRERAENQYSLAAHRANADAMIELAKEVARLKNPTADVQTQISELNKRIDAAAKVNAEQVGRLTDATRASFNFIAGIGMRLGYADIVDLARLAPGKLRSSLDRRLPFPEGCTATSHFFNYADEGQPLKRCDSAIDIGSGVVGDNGRCRSVRHGDTTPNTSEHTTNLDSDRDNSGHVHMVNMRCWEDWCNFWGDRWEFLGTQRVWQQIQTVSQSVRMKDGIQQAYVGALRAPIISPLLPEAKALLARPAGAPFPADRKTMLGLRVFGNAHKWRLSNMKNQSIDIDGDAFRVQDAAAGNVYEIPASMFLAHDDGFAGFTELARVQALDARGEPVGRQCLHGLNGGAVPSLNGNVSYTSPPMHEGLFDNHQLRFYYSPIVLDLTGKGHVVTVSPRDSKAEFDMTGSGRKERVGWVSPDAGLLVMDLNGNGRIDNGRELFGNHTLLDDGSEALDGYQALAQFDADGSGAIDSRDPAFARLRVWIDVNGNGVSERDELHGLTSLGITSVGARASDVPLADQMQYAEDPAHNLLLYKGSFTASFCPRSGCVSYDIYFGSDRSIGLVSAK